MCYTSETCSSKLMCGHERFFCHSELDELKWACSLRLFCGLSKCLVSWSYFKITDMPLITSLFWQGLMILNANGLARIESDWTLRDGVNSLISNISCTKELNLFWHFFRTKNYLRDSALIIYVNLQLPFLTVYLNHFWTWKWRHDATETSFDFTRVDFYFFL